MFKTIMMGLGGLIGLLVAYALRPSHWGYRPSLSEMFSIAEFQSEAFLYIGICAVVGLGIGVVIDRLRQPRDKE